MLFCFEFDNKEMLAPPGVHILLSSLTNKNEVIFLIKHELSISYCH